MFRNSDLDFLRGSSEPPPAGGTAPDPVTFRRVLAARIAALLGALSLTGSAAGCWDGETILTGFGGGASTDPSTGGAAGATTGTTTTSTATSTCAASNGAQCEGFPQTQCFPSALPCPTDPCVALSALNAVGCDAQNGYQACQINSGPTQPSGGMCCYGVAANLCTPGGRPYLVEARAVVAATVLGAGERGWSEGERPDLGALTAGERATLAKAWTASGLLEHASVASFSRFSLSLLAAGAPAALVHETHRAALDEIVHARLCFALASAYRGAAIAPGPFPIAGDVPVSASLAAIAASAVEEGCIGETVAAVIASEQLARATDPAVRAALARIASDEARHAELAWRTVTWAVRTGGSEVRAAVAGVLLGVLGGVAGRTPKAADAAGGRSVPMEAHGYVDQATLAAAVAAAMAEVVAPAARALLQPGRDDEAAAGPHEDRTHFGIGSLC